jgi:CHAT domain-containing protein/tetratricopeptide (TPR) repeat protein
MREQAACFVAIISILLVVSIKPMAAEAANVTSRPRCLIVETVLGNSGDSATTIKILKGDCLLSYDSRPLPSPSALHAQEDNTFKKAALRVRRGRKTLVIAVKPGPLGLEVRPELPPSAITFYDEGQAFLRAEKHELAVLKFEEAARIAKAAGDQATAAWLQRRIGEEYAGLGKWKEALGTQDVAWQLLESIDDPAGKSRTAAALGGCSQNLSDLTAAQRWLNQALLLDTNAGFEIWVARDLDSLGNIAWLRSDFQEALENYSRALEIRERLSPGSLAVARSLYNLGKVAWSRGDLATALDYDNRSLKIQERLAPDSLEVAATLTDLGNIAFDTGDLSAASGYHSRSLAIRERLAANSSSAAISLNSLGGVAWARGDLQGAQDYYLRALNILEKFGDSPRDIGNNLSNLGTVAAQRGDKQSAKGYFERALIVYQQLAPSSLDVAATFHNLGSVAYEQGDLQSAQEYMARALAIKKILAPNSLDTAISLTDLGNVAIDRSDLATARGYLSSALLIFDRLSPNSLTTASALNNLGYLALKENRFTDAVDTFSRAVSIVVAQRGQIISPEGRALLAAQYTDPYTGLLRSYLELHNLPAAFLTIERARARTLVELLAERNLNLRSEIPANLLAEQVELDKKRSDAYGKLAKLDAEKDKDLVSELRLDLDRYTGQQKMLEERVRQLSPQFASLRYPEPLDLKSAQATLEPGTLVLTYYVDKKETYLLSVSKTSIEIHRLPVAASGLEKQIKAFCDEAAAPSPLIPIGEVQERGRQLYNILVRPAQSMVDKAQRLILSLDGPLQVLPFAALVTAVKPRVRYLSDEKPLDTVSSLTAFVELHSWSASKQKRKMKTLVAFGDPIYIKSQMTAEKERGTSQRQELAGMTSEQMGAGPIAELEKRGLRLVPLPGTRDEVENIAKLFGKNALIRLGLDATKTIVKRDSKEADILHFACHGWLDGQQGLNSGLVLTQPEALGIEMKEDNGLLQAWEIFEQLHLNASLVVLSACQTGLGQELRGEGLIGLTRAFLYAGAKSVVVSLWEVNDRSTSELMRAFYYELLKGIGKDEALRRAMVTVRRDPRWRHPFYWSPFILVGDWK